MYVILKFEMRLNTSGMKIFLFEEVLCANEKDFFLQDVIKYQDFRRKKCIRVITNEWKSCFGGK